MSAIAGAEVITDQAFFTALVANVGLLALEVGLFVILKKKLDYIYSPRTSLPPQTCDNRCCRRDCLTDFYGGRKRAKELPGGPWRWLPAIIMAPSEDIVSKSVMQPSDLFAETPLSLDRKKWT
jgi:hypothetical protein